MLRPEIPEFSPTTTPLLPVLREPLVLADRCDQCRVQAFVRVEFISGGELLLCSHHFNDHQPALIPLASYIQDERSLINQKPGV
jgi:hypothetical protein